MSKFAAIAILALCSVAAFARTVPTVDSCVSHTFSPGQSVIHNNCGAPIQVELRYSDGNSQLLEMSGNQQTIDGDGHTSVKWFACYPPATPTSNPNSFVSPQYGTSQYWCMQP